MTESENKFDKVLSRFQGSGDTVRNFGFARLINRYGVPNGAKIRKLKKKASICRWIK